MTEQLRPVNPLDQCRNDVKQAVYDLMQSRGQNPDVMFGNPRVIHEYEAGSPQNTEIQKFTQLFYPNREVEVAKLHVHFLDQSFDPVNLVKKMRDTLQDKSETPHIIGSNDDEFPSRF